MMEELEWAGDLLPVQVWGFVLYLSGLTIFLRVSQEANTVSHTRPWPVNGSSYIPSTAVRY